MILNILFTGKEYSKKLEDLKRQKKIFFSNFIFIRTGKGAKLVKEWGRGEGWRLDLLFQPN